MEPTRPTDTMHFRWPWRPYQARVLAALEQHLSDDRLHVVAAPGSGKTVLGIEIFRRLGRPALVLSPTQTIRDQWITRLGDFLPDAAETPGWASRDLEAPAFFTSITYQAIHVRHRTLRVDSVQEEDAEENPPDRAELASLRAVLLEKQIEVLILDEAHHLRKAWWKALAHLIDGLEKVTVVSLTATPPYDALGTEWQRYETLCGPVDEEISVPELVRSGTLCAHQDYVYVVEPTEEERQLLHDHDVAVDALTHELLSSDVLLAAVSSHRWIDSPTPEEVLHTPELAVALMVYLQARGVVLPPALLHLLNTTAEEIPSLSRRWWQVLLAHYLFDKSWTSSTASLLHRDALKQRLRRTGLLWRRELRLNEPRPVIERLTMSAAKLEACAAIYRLELQRRGDSLRMVILTDFIRAGEADRLGAWPIFQRLAEAAQPPEQHGLALVTGRLALLHTQCLEALRARGPLPVWLEYAPYTARPSFLRVQAKGRSSRLVALFTHLLQRGDVQVLVGTRALLGEGWDAPAINTLVLASYVGSFVATNQMRGRAIRRAPRDPDKEAHIWHVAAVEGTSQTGQADWKRLERSFSTFVGLAEDGPFIETGLRRLALPDPRHGALHDTLNRLAAERLDGASRLQERWREAIERGEVTQVVPSVRITRPPKRPRVLFWNTLRYLVYSGLSAGYLGFYSMLELATEARITYKKPLLVLAAAALVALLLSAPPLYRAARTWLRTLPVDGTLRQIALALRDALVEAELLTSLSEPLDVEVQEVAQGIYLAALRGGTFYEQSIFADAMDEVLGPIANPRYLVTRRSDQSQHIDYHAVPRLLAVNKEKATLFHRHWTRRLGAAELIYTRAAEGRKALVAARARAFSTTFVPPAERLDRWQ